MVVMEDARDDVPVMMPFEDFIIHVQKASQASGWWSTERIKAIKAKYPGLKYD